MMLAATIPADIPDSLSARDRGFLSRVYGGDPERYHLRLRQAGMAGHGHVLDAGCGFGQWTNALASLSREVSAIDIDPMRVESARAMQRHHRNISWHQGSITSLPFADNSFDALFSYSVIYYTDPRLALSEFARVLKPGISAPTAWDGIFIT